MPKFVLPSLFEALDRGRAHRLLTLVVAGFIRYLRGVDEQGEPIAINDSRADELRRLVNEGGTDPRSVLSVQRVFGDLGQRAEFVAELSAAFAELEANGAKATVHSATHR